MSWAYSMRLSRVKQIYKFFSNIFFCYLTLGHCLVTVATGEIEEVEADRAGLVPTHAYAMLDVREHKVHTYRHTY